MVWLATAQGSDLESQSLRRVPRCPVRTAARRRCPRRGTDDAWRCTCSASRAAVQLPRGAFCRASRSAWPTISPSSARAPGAGGVRDARLRMTGCADGDLLMVIAPCGLLREQMRAHGRLHRAVFSSPAERCGKELVALSLHQQSRRNAGPLVAVDSARHHVQYARGEELFGHEKDASPGERERRATSAAGGRWHAVSRPKSANCRRIVRRSCCRAGYEPFSAAGHGRGAKCK